ncbi:MAG: hypothetical protein ACR2N7_10515 [Acidimicrobiia bacterium]
MKSGFGCSKAKTPSQAVGWGIAKARDRWIKVVIWIVVAMMVLTLMAALLPTLS